MLKAAKRSAELELFLSMTAKKRRNNKNSNNRSPLRSQKKRLKKYSKPSSCHKKSPLKRPSLRRSRKSVRWKSLKHYLEAL